MPNGQFNPLATLASSARQINEQANQVVKSLGDSFTQTTNQLLTSAAQGLPLPPLPGAQASNPGNSRGNPNGPATGGFPLLQQLIPTQALQAVSQVEDVILPPGIPRPSQALLQAAGVRPRRAAAAPPVEEVAPVAAEPRRVTPGVEGAQTPATARRPSRALGIQAL